MRSDAPWRMSRAPSSRPLPLQTQRARRQAGDDLAVPGVDPQELAALAQQSHVSPSRAPLVFTRPSS